MNSITKSHLAAFAIAIVVVGGAVGMSIRAPERIQSLLLERPAVEITR